MLTHWIRALSSRHSKSIVINLKQYGSLHYFSILMLSDHLDRLCHSYIASRLPILGATQSYDALDIFDSLSLMEFGHVERSVHVPMLNPWTVATNAMESANFPAHLHPAEKSHAVLLFLEIVAYSGIELNFTLTSLINAEPFSLSYFSPSIESWMLSLLCDPLGERIVLTLVQSISYCAFANSLFLNNLSRSVSHKSSYTCAQISSILTKNGFDSSLGTQSEIDNNAL